MSKMLKVLLAILAVVIAVIGIKSGYQVGVRSGFPVAYGEYIAKYSFENELDPCLVMAVIKVESNFVPEAQSDYAYGLMQLTEETADWNAKNMGLINYDYTDPETNIQIGCYYLKYLIDRYGVIDTALAAYNGGMSNVGKWLDDKNCSEDGKNLKYIPFTETRNYVVKVNQNWEHYKKLYQ